MFPFVIEGEFKNNVKSWCAMCFNFNIDQWNIKTFLSLEDDDESFKLHNLVKSPMEKKGKLQREKKWLTTLGHISSSNGNIFGAMYG